MESMTAAIVLAAFALTKTGVTVAVEQREEK
jgi:hypothetical protein